MEIGTMTVKDFKTDNEIFEAGLTNLSIQAGMMFAEVSGTFRDKLQLDRKQIYKVSISGIAGQQDFSLLCAFDDYIFSAGGTDYVDGEGVYHSGVAVLNNRFQFTVLSSI